MYYFVDGLVIEQSATRLVLWTRNTIFIKVLILKVYYMETKHKDAATLSTSWVGKGSTA